MPHKPGPKTELGGTPMTRRTLTYDDMTQRMLKVLGNGSASRGARVAARIAYKMRSLNPCTRIAEPADPQQALPPPEPSLPDEPPG
jgi:hypothetical protein